MVDQDLRKTTYMAKDAKHELAIMIEGGPCRDSMSGESFDTTVTVILAARLCIKAAVYSSKFQ